MRPILLLAFTALLTACRPEEPAPETTVPTTVTEAELLAAVDCTPHPLPNIRSAALGVAGTLTGRVSPTYPVGQAVSLAARVPLAPPEFPGPGFRWPDAGRIVAPGWVKVRLPPAPDLTGSEWVPPWTGCGS